jgi:hypothetical protein
MKQGADHRVTRSFGMPFGIIENAGDQPALVFDAGQG